MSNILEEEQVCKLRELSSDPDKQFRAFRDVIGKREICYAQDEGTNSVYKRIVDDTLFLSYRFGEEHKWSPIETATYVGLLYEFFTKSFFGCGQPLGLEDSYEIFSSLVRQYSIPTPPCNQQVFSLNQVESIVEHVGMTVFKHYESYSTAFRKSIPNNCKVRKVEISIPVPRLAAFPLCQAAEGSPQADVQEN